MQVGTQFLVIPGGRGVRRQEQHVRNIIARREIRRLEIHDGRNKHDAIKGNASIDQVTGQCRGARCTITLAGKKQRRRPTFVTRQVHANKLAESFDIAFDAEIVFE